MNLREHTHTDEADVILGKLFILVCFHLPRCPLGKRNFQKKKRKKEIIMSVPLLMNVLVIWGLCKDSIVLEFTWVLQVEQYCLILPGKSLRSLKHWAHSCWASCPQMKHSLGSVNKSKRVTLSAIPITLTAVILLTTNIMSSTKYQIPREQMQNTSKSCLLQLLKDKRLKQRN